MLLTGLKLRVRRMGETDEYTRFSLSPFMETHAPDQRLF